MAFTANTAFEPRITNNEFDELCNITGKYFVSTTASDCDAGQLCQTGDALPAEGFTGVDNENAYKMVQASTGAAGAPIYACNTYDSQLLGDGSGNLYHVGHKMLGLGIPADRYGTFTIINFDGRSKYRFGVGNLNSALSTNGYATIVNGKLTPAAAAPETAGTRYFKVIGTGNFTEGTSASFGYVDVLALTA